MFKLFKLEKKNLVSTTWGDLSLKNAKAERVQRLKHNKRPTQKKIPIPIPIPIN
jgi:hypothetical protein